MQHAPTAKRKWLKNVSRAYSIAQKSVTRGEEKLLRALIEQIGQRESGGKVTPKISRLAPFWLLVFSVQRQKNKKNKRQGRERTRTKWPGQGRSQRSDFSYYCCCFSVHTR